MRLTGSQALLNAMLNEGVEILFGYPGGAIMPTYDALYDMKNNLRHILVRHEQGAVHAAVGYARASGKTGVCLATSGPGATNLITGIADAMMDSVPLVCITGQVAEKFLGTDAFQEADIVGMTVPATKWNYQITSVKEIPDVMQKAFAVARSGRPGPVLIDITKNVQLENYDYESSSFKTLTHLEPNTFLDTTEIEKATALLNDAKKPMILVGHGVTLAQAESILLALAEKADLPVAATLLGLSAFPSQHRLFKGLLGMHGNYAANLLSNQADVVLALGMRFDDRVTGDLSQYLTHAKLVHVDIDPAELNKNIKAAVAVNADVKRFLSVLLPLLHRNKHTLWHQQFYEKYNKEKNVVITNSTKPKNGSIKMAEVIALLSKKTKGKALLVTDVGQHQMIAARYYQFTQTRSHITSGGLGTMGFSLPAAIGAKLAAMDRVVISISGDGGFQMNLQELAVIMQEKLDVKIIILNNGYLGMVRQWQELFFEKRYAFTEMQSPNFVALAHAYNIKASKVSQRKNLSVALDHMLADENAYLLEICVEKEDNVFPMVPTGASISDTRLN